MRLRAKQGCIRGIIHGILVFFVTTSFLQRIMTLLDVS